jgi:rhodanese-related sulfurtransferase
MGKLKNAAHISYDNIESSLQRIPKDKNIIITDEFGEGSAKAATLLTAKGYKNVAILFDGMNNLITSNVTDAACKYKIWEQNKAYHILTADEFNQFAKYKKVTIVDVRTADEFNNQSKDAWRNTGHIKNAVNIPANEFKNKIETLASPKADPIVVYSSSRIDAYNAAAILVANGYSNVNILAGGIFNLRWRAANVKGKADLKDWVVSVPADNL